jgi:hypothetical protein
MKQINSKLFLKTGIRTMAVIVPICLMAFVFSCENMNSIHEKYINRGETIYIGVADSVKVHPGKNKIGFEWKIGADPRITQTVIYWNQRESNVVIPVNRTSESEMWLDALIDNMPEGEYIFEFETQDANGNISKTLEVAGAVLGDIYVENLRNRGIKEISRLVTGETQISWEDVSATATSLLYSIVEYVDPDGVTQILEVPNSEKITAILGLSTGDAIEIYTIHLPENGLEQFQSVKRNFIVPKFEREMDKSRFKDTFKPGDNTTPHPGDGVNDWQKSITDFGVGQRSLAKIWDGGSANNTNGMTILHTSDQTGQWGAARFKFPHKFTFDIGVLANLSRIHIWARTDNGAFTGHSPRYFEVWATDEPKGMDDFPDQAAFEEYYRTTYVVHGALDNQINTNPNGDAAHAGQGYELFVEPAPAPGIHNWQEDWVKLGDFAIEKPSASNFNTSNDADKAIWAAGSDFELRDTGRKVRYIRLVLKFPNWQQTNCINLGEITLYGDDL